MVESTLSADAILVEDNLFSRIYFKRPFNQLSFCFENLEFELDFEHFSRVFHMNYGRSSKPSLAPFPPIQIQMNQ